MWSFYVCVHSGYCWTAVRSPTPAAGSTLLTSWGARLSGLWTVMALTWCSRAILSYWYSCYLKQVWGALLKHSVCAGTLVVGVSRETPSTLHLSPVYICHSQGSVPFSDVLAVLCPLSLYSLRGEWRKVEHTQPSGCVCWTKRVQDVNKNSKLSIHTIWLPLWQLSIFSIGGWMTQINNTL